LRCPRSAATQVHQITSGSRAAIAIATLALAGCLGGGSEPAGQQANPAAASDPSAAIGAPNWSAGDYWTYAPEEAPTSSWVVTQDAGDAWIVRPDDKEAAFLDARSDISFFGERRKSDLAGSQGETRVEYFDWPLEENKTWTTTWDGVERTVTVDRVEDGRAQLTARHDGRLAVEYTYERDAGPFGSVTFYDANGSVVNDLELQDSGEDFQGTAYRYTLAKVLDRQGTFGAQPTGFGFEFTVPPNATDIWLDLAVECPSGAYDFGFGGNGSGYSNRGTCPANATGTGVVVEGPNPGNYRGGFAGHSPAGEGSFRFLMFVRTLNEVPAEGR
jgi:hypothetical protein